jgi:hypothetical protein
MNGTKGHHRVTPEGKMIGALMVRLAEAEIARLAIEGEPDERCASCAFRLGTVPNGCPQTQMDVSKAVAEKVPFMCHAVKQIGTKVCHGWFAAVREAQRRPNFAMLAEHTRKIPFSPPDEV